MRAFVKTETFESFLRKGSMKNLLTTVLESNNVLYVNVAVAPFQNQI